MFKKSEIVVVDGRLYHLGIKKSELAENIFIVGDPARAVRVSNRRGKSAGTCSPDRIRSVPVRGHGC